ncbi:MAG: hypothetical protein HOH19_01275 [Kordiimonadaceae bacterium]|jgi:hypothetical protein|nr:hypothetical protein [Kordiimonadaceae bacterium]MBT6031178.1 hypothetical protein [Kordiimonadaceae bacterium]
MAVRPNKPVVFGKKKVLKPEEKQEDDTLDMLLHYAKAGMEHAEQSLKDDPDLFSSQEREAFLQNKNMLDQAPFLIDTYKTKISEHDALHKKMLGILVKCEEIVASGDNKAKEEIKGVLKEASVISYSEDGELVVKKAMN